MSGKKDLAVLMRQLQAQGFTLEKSRSNHWKVKRDGRLITAMPCTPGDWRGQKNRLSVLRKAGYNG